MGAGKTSPRPTRDPRGPEAWGPCCPVRGGVGGDRLCSPQGWVEFRARGQRSDGNLQRSSGRVLALLAHLCRAVSRGKSQPGNLGFVEASVHTEGAAPFLQPLFPTPPTPTPLPIPPPCKGQLVRLSWQGWPGAQAGETASGARPRGHTASHGLQRRRKENSERLQDPEIINVGAGRSLPCHRPAPRSRQGVGPGREGA